jgi:hypothetical protein
MEKRKALRNVFSGVLRALWGELFRLFRSEFGMPIAAGVSP